LEHYTGKADYAQNLNDEVSGYIEQMIEHKNAVIETANYIYTPKGRDETTY